MMIVRTGMDIFRLVTNSLNNIYKEDYSMIYRMLMDSNKHRDDLMRIDRMVKLFLLVKHKKTNLVCLDNSDISNGHESLIKLPEFLPFKLDMRTIPEGTISGFLLGSSQLLFTYIVHRRDLELQCGNIFFDKYIDNYDEKIHKTFFKILGIMEKYSQDCPMVYKGISNVIHYKMSEQLINKISNDIYWPLQKILQNKADELNINMDSIKNAILSMRTENIIPGIQIASMHNVTNFNIRKYAIKGKVLSKICYTSLTKTQKRAFFINLSMFFSHKLLPYKFYIIHNDEYILPKFIINEKRAKEIKHRYQLTFDMHQYIKMKYSFDNFRVVIDRIAMRMAFKSPVMIYLFYILRHLCRYFYINMDNIRYVAEDIVFLLPFISI